MARRDEVRGDREADFRLPLLADLVADRPHHDGRVVAVAADEVREVRLPPVVEVAGVGIGSALADRPHVERLVQHEKTEPVAGVQHLDARRVVRCAHGVRAHLLQELQLALERACVGGRAERAGVRMLADAAQLQVAAVEEQPLLRAERDRPHAEGLAVDIHLPVDGGHAHLQHVEVRIVHVPEMHVADDAAPVRERRDGARPVEDGAGDRARAAGDLHVRRHLGVLAPHGAAHGHAPRVDVDLRREREPHAAVEAAAVVPAPAPLAVLQAHRQMLPRARHERVRRVHAERDEAERPLADLPSVDVDGRQRHRAAEVEVDLPAPLRLRHREVALVPARAEIRQAPQHARDLRGERKRHTPVVRQAHALPCRGVEVGRLRPLRLRRRMEAGERPPRVQPFPRRPGRGGLHRRPGEERRSRHQSKHHVPGHIRSFPCVRLPAGTPPSESYDSTSTPYCPKR